MTLDDDECIFLGMQQLLISYDLLLKKHTKPHKTLPDKNLWNKKADCYHLSSDNKMSLTKSTQKEASKNSLSQMVKCSVGLLCVTNVDKLITALMESIMNV